MVKKRRKETGVERDLEVGPLPVGQGDGLRALRDLPEVREEQFSFEAQSLGLGSLLQLFLEPVPVALTRGGRALQAGLQLPKAPFPSSGEQREEDARRRGGERVGPQGLRLGEEDGEAREVPLGRTLAG